MKKRYFAVLGAITACLMIFSSRNTDTVALIQFIEHPALDQTRKGFEDEAKKLFPKLNFKYESAQGNPNLASQIAQKFSYAKVLVTLGTTSTQMAMKTTKKIPIVFASVTDPSTCVKNIKSPNSNVTGVSNYVDMEQQIAYFKSLQKDLKILGVVYNPGELNSVKQMENLRIIAKKHNIELVEKIAIKITDVPISAQSIVNKIDAIFVISDNTSLSAYETIVRLKKPVYVSDIDCLEKGGTAALGADQYALGVQSAQMVKKILDGEKISKIPVEWPKIIIKKSNRPTASSDF